jgi:hypothetical protein
MALYWKFLIRLTGFIAGLMLTVTVLAQVSTHFDLGWHLLSGGGGNRSSSNYRVDDTLGQWAAGTSSSTNYKIEPGFFYGAVSMAQCHTLTLTHTGSGGDPLASPARSSGCAANGQYVAGEAISLSANPAAGWVVNGWSGTANDASHSNTNSLSMPAMDHTVQVNYAAQPDAYEVDDVCSQAHLIQVNGSLQEHTFHVAGDADWVRLQVTENAQYRIEVQTPINSDADVNLGLYPACDLGPTDVFEETFTPGVRLDFTAVTTGPVYVRLVNEDASRAGPEVLYRLTVRELQPDAQKGAVILLAGRLRTNDALQANIHHVINRAYELYKQQGYSDDEILYLAVDPALPGSDQGATVANLRDAITSWAVNRVGPEQPLVIYLMDHGDVDQLFVDEVNQQHINPAELNTWLDQLETAVPNVKVTVIVEACYSGSFIEGVQSVSQAGRTIISSTDGNNVAFASADGAQFSDQFLTGLSQDNGICMSFRNAQDAVQQLSNIQEPWIDANGNQVPNEAADCEAADLQIPVSGHLPEDSWAPYIVMVEGPDDIVDQKGVIRAQVRDNKGVGRVWAVIYPPSYVAPRGGQELVPENLPSIDLAAQGNEMYSVEYTHFDEVGRYRIAIYAQDESGLKTGPYVLEAQNGYPLFLPILFCLCLGTINVILKYRTK